MRAFDLIVFNPPYLPKENPIDPQWSGGIDVIKKFIENTKNHLEKDGKIILLVSTLTDEKQTIDIIEKNGYKHRILAKKKVPWEELVVFEVKL